MTLVVQASQGCKFTAAWLCRGAVARGVSGTLSSPVLSVLFCSEGASPLQGSRDAPSAPHGELLIHPLAGVNTIWGAVRTGPPADTLCTLSGLRNYYCFSRQLSLFISGTTVNEEAEHAPASAAGLQRKPELAPWLVCVAPELRQTKAQSNTHQTVAGNH